MNITGETRSSHWQGNQYFLGHKHTQEALAKMKAAAKARWTDPDYRANMVAARIGHKHTPEHRAKLRVAGTGRKHTAETIAKMSASQRGHGVSAATRAKMRAAAKMWLANPSNHPNWRGGISREPYGWEWNEELREEVRRRDGYKCQLCGAPQVECGKVLDVHHINYLKRDNDPMNLVALCHACHSRTSFRRKHWTVFFEAKMGERA